MTSSNSGNGDQRNGANGSGNGQPLIGSGATPDFLDAAALTRLANEFMQAAPDENILSTDMDKMLKGQTGASSQPLPTEAQLRQLPSTLGAASSMPFSGIPMLEPYAMPTQPALPAGYDPQALAATSSLSGSSAPPGYDPRAIAAMPAVPGMPPFLGVPSLSGMPSLAGASPLPGVPSANQAMQMPTDFPFGFLNEIRPLVAYATQASSTSPAPALRGFSPTNDTYVNEVSKAAEDLANLSTAQIPGATMYPGVQQGATAYSAQQMPRIDVIPFLEPMSMPTSAGLANLNLSGQSFDVEAIRRDFPILQEKINGHNLVWLDNAATTQKPQSVIDRLNFFYTHENSNIHRAAHELAARSTDAYEAARESVRRFLNASSSSEIIFVRGATEAINLVAQSWGRQNIQKDDEIVITHLEHHANIVPWQMLCAEKGARLRVAPVDDHGQIMLDEYERLLGPRTRLVSLAQVSNALGTVTPVDKMVAAAHRHGARVLVDGAQAVSHMRVDVQEYDCDFYVFSGHKLFAPTGIGVVYGKAEVLESMRPWQGGGNMIQDVTFEKTTYQPPPGRFEAGTGSIADAVGLGAAIEYLERIGMVNITRHENELMAYGTDGLKKIPGLHLIGTASEKAGVLSFVLDGFRNEDVSAALNQQGIAVRAGHHCAQPILRRFGVESTVRPSLALYNSCEDIDALIAGIWNLKQGRGPSPL